jgi:hypothetical protein
MPDGCSAVFNLPEIQINLNFDIAGITISGFYLFSYLFTDLAYADSTITYRGCSNSARQGCGIVRISGHAR